MTYRQKIKKCYTHTCNKKYTLILEDIMKSNGKITMIVGPMFAEKSGELIITCETLMHYAKKNVKVYKPANDDRFSETEIVSRIGHKIEAENLPTKLTEDIVKKVIEDCKEYDVVAFDEVHFFSKGIVDIVYELSMMGKDIYIVGLNLDYTASTFGSVGDLLAISDEVKIKRAYCTVCGKEAKFTQRIINGMPAEFGKQVLIGDKEEYEVRCKNHYIHPSKAKEYKEKMDVTTIVLNDNNEIKTNQKEG